MLFSIYVAPQTSRHIRARGGNYSMSFLWLPAATEWPSVHLLQEQPPLLHSHGTNRWPPTCCISFKQSSFPIFHFFWFYSSGSSHAEGRLVHLSSLWISCPLLTVPSVSGPLVCLTQTQDVITVVMDNLNMLLRSNTNNVNSTKLDFSRLSNRFFSLDFWWYQSDESTQHVCR